MRLVLISWRNYPFNLILMIIRTKFSAPSYFALFEKRTDLSITMANQAPEFIFHFDSFSGIPFWLSGAQ